MLTTHCAAWKQCHPLFLHNPYFLKTESCSLCYGPGLNLTGTFFMAAMTWDHIAILNAQVLWGAVLKWTCHSKSQSSGHKLWVMTETMRWWIKRLRWFSFTGWLALGTEFGARKSRRSSDKDRWKSKRKGAYGDDQASDQNASWKNFRHVPDWEETPGQTQNTQEGLHNPPGLEYLRITQEELEKVARGKSMIATLLTLLKPLPRARKAAEDGEMDE